MLERFELEDYSGLHFFLLFLLFHCNIENYFYSVKIGPIAASQISESKKVKKIYIYFLIDWYFVMIFSIVKLNITLNSKIIEVEVNK